MNYPDGLFFNIHRLGYGMNTAMYGREDGSGNIVTPQRKYDSILRPFGNIVCADSDGNGTWDSSIYNDMENAAYGMGTRHGGGTNILWADWHVTHVGPTERNTIQNTWSYWIN